MIRVEANALRDALRTVLPAVPPRINLPVLMGARLTVKGGRLTIQASDLQFAITTSCSCGEGDLDVVAPAKLLAEYASKCSGALTLAEKDDDLILQSSGPEVALRTMNPADWPILDDAEGEALALPGEALAGLARVMPAASTDAAREVLCAVNISREGWVATDSYRLHHYAWPEGFGEQYGDGVNLSPAQLAAILKAVDGDVTLALDDRRATFRSGPTTWTARLTEGSYPNWKQLIPASQPHKFTVKREAFADALSFAAPLADDTNAMVRLSVSGDGLTVQALRRDVGEARHRIAASTTTDYETGFNGVKLTEALRATDDGEDVTVSFTDALKPIVLDGAGCRALLMPVRLA